MNLKIIPRAAVPLAIIGLCIALPMSSSGIPAFSRQTKMPCNACHFGGTNRLTRIGRDFLYRGMRQATTEAPKDVSDIKLGDYVSVGMETDFNSATNMDPSTTFESSYHLNIGGPLTKNAGLYADTHLDGSPPEEGFIQYTSNPEKDAYYFARAGDIRPNIFHDFGIVHPVSASVIRAFGEPIWADPNDSMGIGFNLSDSVSGASIGLHTKDDIFAEAGFQNGPDTGSNAKVVYGSLEKMFTDDGSSLGVFGTFSSVDLTGSSAYTDKFSRVAALGSFEKENFLVTGSYVWGQDNVAGGGNRHANGYSLELARNSTPDMTPFARYEKFDTKAGLTADAKIIGVSWRLGNLGRFVLEGFEDKTGDTTSRGTAMTLDWRF